MGERAMLPEAAWAALAEALRAPEAGENDGPDRLASAAAMVWAVGATLGREVLGAAGFDPTRPTEWVPQQYAVEQVLQVSDGAITPPPEARPFQRALEGIRPGLFAHFVQWLWRQEPAMELRHVAGGPEQPTCDVLASFFQFSGVEPTAPQRLFAVRELLRTRLTEGPEEIPQGAVELVTPLGHCTVHHAPADMYCPNEMQFVCALCLAPGGRHAGHEAHRPRRVSHAEHAELAAAPGEGEGAVPHHAGPQQGAPLRGPDPAVGPRADCAGLDEGRGREPADEPAPEHQEPVREPEGSPKLSYPCRPLQVGERFEWLPSQLGPRGLQFALADGDTLPKGVQLDDKSGCLRGCPEETGDPEFEVTCGEAKGRVSFTVTAVEPWIRTIAGNGSSGRAISNDPLQTHTSYPWGVAADADYVYVSQDIDAHSILRIPRRGGAAEIVAGGGDSEADGVPATEAKLHPRGLALDGDSLYVCTYNKVRRVELRPGGLIHTVAGCGQGGHSGDGGPATSAKLNWPTRVAVHGRMLYVACSYAVRRVDLRSGRISTFAGNGTSGFSGDRGRATAAQLSSPFDVCVSDGALYIADSSNHRVRRVDLATGLIATAAGGGEAAPDGRSAPTSVKLSHPRGLAADGGAIYVTDDHRVLLLRGGALVTVCGTTSSGYSDGSTAGGRLNSPYGIALARGALYVADYSNRRVREISPLPPQPPTDGAQVQQWSWEQGAEGAGMLSAELTLPRGSALCKMFIKKPPVGVIMSLSFADAPGAPLSAELLMAVVGPRAKGVVALRSDNLPREAALRGGGQHYFCEENTLEVSVKRAQDNETGGMTYTLDCFFFTFNGRGTTFPADPIRFTTAPDLPARLCVTVHRADGGAEAQIPFACPPLLVEGLTEP